MIFYIDPAQVVCHVVRQTCLYRASPLLIKTLFCVTSIEIMQPHFHPTNLTKQVYKLVFIEITSKLNLLGVGMVQATPEILVVNVCCLSTSILRSWCGLRVNVKQSKTELLLVLPSSPGRAIELSWCSLHL